MAMCVRAYARKSVRACLPACTAQIHMYEVDILVCLEMVLWLLLLLLL